MARLSNVNVNSDLARERQKATFNVEKLTNILDGSDLATVRRRYLETEVLKDSVIAGESDIRFLTREESYDQSIKKSACYIRKLKELNSQGFEDAFYIRSTIFPSEVTPLSLAMSMFPRMIELQGSEAQVEKWLAKTRNFEILGTYAQTELGHGTQVKNLETTATYDPRSEEFIMHSPTLTAAKFWPGGLGKTTNHAVVMARLITKGIDHGVHAFFVQTRDVHTHQPLPGVTLGDIGVKFGYETMDNGYMRFNNHRIPRENLLMKFYEVTKDGTYVKKPTHDKLLYGAMLATRIMIVMEPCASCLSKAVTIAIRYSCVRHQSEIIPGNPEPAVIEYQTQQQKLLPQLAAAYAFQFLGKHLLQDYLRIYDDLQQGKMDELPELHATSAGLKAVVSTAAMRGVERCRLACGGHGYSLASGFFNMYTYMVPASTYEGDNTVMLLQTARYLLKSVEQLKQGGKCSGTTAYLQARFDAHWGTGRDVTPDALVLALKYRAVKSIERAASNLTRTMATSRSPQQAWNQSGVLLAKAAEDHCQVIIASVFLERIRLDVNDSSIFSVLLSLFVLYAANEILADTQTLLMDGYMSAADVNVVESLWFDCIAELRGNVVALVDAFDFTDHHLMSVLGRYDGQVYENLLHWAKSSPLNKTQVHESFEHIRAMRQAKL